MGVGLGGALVTGGAAGVGALGAAPVVASTGPVLTLVPASGTAGPADVAWPGRDDAPTVKAGPAAGRPVFGPLAVTTQVDASMPDLFRGVTAGTKFQTATLEVPGGSGSITYTFTGVQVSQVTWSASGVQVPNEEVEFKYLSVTIKETSASGQTGTAVGWNLTQNKLT